MNNLPEGLSLAKLRQSAKLMEEASAQGLHVVHVRNKAMIKEWRTAREKLRLGKRLSRWDRWLLYYFHPQ